MKQQKITTDEILELSDTISKMAGQAERCSQVYLKTACESALALLIEAAKNAAFHEALDRRRDAVTPKPLDFTHPSSECTTPRGCQGCR